MVNKIYNCNCLDLFSKLPIVNAIITDPPYLVSMKNNFHTLNRRGIHFGEWDENFNLTSWIRPAVDKLKAGGNIIIFSDWRNMGEISKELVSCNCLVKEMIQWKKTNPMPRNRDRLYVTSCEFAVWATKGKGWTFNRQRNTYEDTTFIYPIVSNKDRMHPTQKHLLLMEDLIKIHTNEGDLILDPFAGSGTTLLAAKRCGRNFIGCELDTNYFSLAQNRIENYMAS